MNKCERIWPSEHNTDVRTPSKMLPRLPWAHFIWQNSRSKSEDHPNAFLEAAELQNPGTNTKILLIVLYYWKVSMTEEPIHWGIGLMFLEEKFSPPFIMNKKVDFSICIRRTTFLKPKEGQQRLKFNLVSMSSVCRLAFCKISRAWVEFLPLMSSDTDHKHFLKFLWNRRATGLDAAQGEGGCTANLWAMFSSSFLTNCLPLLLLHRVVRTFPDSELTLQPLILPESNKWEPTARDSLFFLLPALTKPCLHLHFSNSLEHVLNIKVMQDLCLWLKVSMHLNAV